jgi:eukaryotic-like serine/threonine-protein kinase
VGALKVNTKIGPYVVDQILPQGKGGMAQVCLAHERLNPAAKVALKISRVDNGATERNINALRGETDILCRINHPNIVKILPLPLDKKSEHYNARALDLPGMPWYFAMEILQGKTLSAVIKGAKTGISEHFVILVGIKVACVLDYIHHMPEPIAYLDMKPENIVFRYPLDGRKPVEPVIIDFGTATRFKDPQTDRGTKAFCPAERLDQLEGKKPLEISVDLTKVDVYGLGVVLYETLTGRLPFGGFTDKGLTTAIRNHAVIPIQTARPGIRCSEGLIRLINRMMSHHPGDRPTAAQVVDDLKVLERQLG